MTGASIVVYLGHGNGWPSRYRDALYPPTQNGFGLNPVAGGDDGAHQYFGEASVDDLQLAPNAVVLLSHLCYASGNTEPGLAEGTLTRPSSGSTTTPPASSGRARVPSSPRATSGRRTTSARSCGPISPLNRSGPVPDRPRQHAPVRQRALAWVRRAARSRAPAPMASTARWYRDR